MMNSPSQLSISSSLIKRFENKEQPYFKKINLNIKEFNTLLLIEPELALIYSRRIIIEILQIISCHNETGHTNFNLIELIELCYQKSLINEKIKNALEEMHGISEIAFSMHQFPIGYTSEKKIHQDEIVCYLKSFSLLLLWFLKHNKTSALQEGTYYNLAPELMKPLHFSQICELEKKYPPQFRTSSDTINTWHKHNPNIYTVITDLKKRNVIGLIEALPLSAEYSDKLYRSELNDTEIPTGAIVQFNKPAVLKLYISSVIIDAFYYNSDIFVFMFDAFLKKLLMLARKGIYFSEVFADIINPQGRKIARYWEMEQVCETLHGSAIYKLTLLPPSLEELLHITDHKTAESLNFYYQRKFKELQEIFEIIL